MKGRASIVGGSIGGKARRVGGTTAEADTIPMLMARCWPLTDVADGSAFSKNASLKGIAISIADITGDASAIGIMTANGESAIPTINGDASRDRQTGLHHWLHVEPEAPQEVVWLDPYGIDYYITTSTGLKWRII